jgi:hypothetical protein
VGSTFLNNASAATAMPARAQVVRVGSGGRRSVGNAPGSQDERNSSATLPDPASPTAPVRRSQLVRDSATGTILEESPQVDQGPFVDPPGSASYRSHQSTTSLSAIIEEATRRASHRGSAPTQGRESSPFGDEHATQE